MALTTYNTIIATAASSNHTKGNYTEIVASTPYDSSRIHISFQNFSAVNLSYLIDIATGAVGVETVIVSNIAIMGNSINTVMGQYLTIDVDIPIGTRLSVRCQCNAANSIHTMNFMLEDRALASIANPVTYGASTTFSIGTQIDPGTTINTKGTYIQLSASTSERIDALGICLTRGQSGVSITVFQTWYVDISIGAASAETIVIPSIRLDVSPTDDWPRPMLIRLPISISAGTRLAVRCQCSVNTAIERLLCVTLIGMQEPTPTALVARESVQFSVVRPE